MENDDFRLSYYAFDDTPYTQGTLSFAVWRSTLCFMGWVYFYGRSHVENNRFEYQTTLLTDMYLIFINVSRIDEVCDECIKIGRRRS